MTRKPARSLKPAIWILNWVSAKTRLSRSINKNTVEPREPIDLERSKFFGDNYLNLHVVIEVAGFTAPQWFRQCTCYTAPQPKTLS